MVRGPRGENGGEPEPPPPLLSLSSIEGFHSKLLRELDNFLSSVRDYDTSRDEADALREYEVEGLAAFTEARRLSMQIAAEAYYNNTSPGGIEALCSEYANGDNLGVARRSLEQAADTELLVDGHMAALSRYKSELDEVGVNPVHPSCVQLSRLKAALDVAKDVGATARKGLDVNPTLFPELPGGGPRSEESQMHHAALQRATQLVTKAVTQRRSLSELSSRNQALAAAAAEYSTAASKAELFRDFCERCVDCLEDKAASDPCGLLSEHKRRKEEADKLGEKVSGLREAASGALEAALREYRRFLGAANDLYKFAKISRVARTQEEIVAAAQQDLSRRFDNEIARLRTLQRGGAESARVAGITRDFLKNFTKSTSEQLGDRIDEITTSWKSAQHLLHNLCERYFAVLRQREDHDQEALKLASQRQQYTLSIATDEQLVALAAQEAAKAQTQLRHTKEEMARVRALLTSLGVTQAIEGETFLHKYDKEKAEDTARNAFELVLGKQREAVEAMAQLADTSPAVVARKGEVNVGRPVFDALYAVLVSAADTQAALGLVELLPEDEVATLAAKLRRGAKNIAVVFSELASTHHGVVQAAHPEQDIPGGATASALLELIAPTMEAMEALVRIVNGVAQGGSAGGHAALREAGRPPTITQQYFGNVSPRLRVSRDGTKLTKPVTGTDLADASALGRDGYVEGTGVHAWGVRLVRRCTNLMIGVADASLPIMGLGNAMKHRHCYLLNVSAGSLWSPALRYEGYPYWPQPLDQDNDVITVVLDTNKAVLSFYHNGRDLGVAFIGLDLKRAMYPAFEVVTSGCEFSFVESTSRPATPSLEASLLSRPGVPPRELAWNDRLV